MQEETGEGSEDPIRTWLGLWNSREDGESKIRSYHVDPSGTNQALLSTEHEEPLRVFSTRYNQREPPTVIAFEARYPGRQRDDEPLVTVVLDVYGDGGFDVDRDHFFFVEPENKEGSVKIRVSGPGEYRSVSEDAVNDWTYLNR